MGISSSRGVIDKTYVLGRVSQGCGSSLGENLGGTNKYTMAASVPITQGSNNNSREGGKDCGFKRLTTLADMDRTLHTDKRGAGERALYTIYSNSTPTISHPPQYLTPILPLSRPVGYPASSAQPTIQLHGQLSN